MDHKTYRSKPLVVAVLLLFVAVLGGEGFAQTDGQAQNEFTKAFQAGKKLYEDGEHKEAALKFLQALTLAKEKGEVVESCFYLSLSYYGLGESDNAQMYLKRMFEAQPEREIDARLFPSGYVTLFYRTKSEFAKPQPAKLEAKPKEEAKPEVKKAELEKKAKEEEKKPVAVGGKAETASQVKKKGKFPWLIVGGLVVVTGVVLYLLLNKKKSPTQGSISVTSTPTGAKVFLYGTDTGLTTSCTLNNVPPGAHVVKLVKDGYADFEQNVTVMAGQTATVNASLTKNSIVVSSPASGTTWIKGTSIDIRWQVDSGALAEKRMGKSDPGGRSDLGRLPGRSEVPEKSGSGFPRSGRSDLSGGRPDGRQESTTPIAAPRFLSSPGYSLQTGGLLGIAKVKIDLYKGGVIVSVIIAETDNDGSYSWQVPVTSSDGSDYKMRVFCSTDSSIYGESGMFTLTSDQYEFVTAWGSLGNGDGQLNYPDLLAVDGSGNLYVADSNNSRIQKFSSNGAFLAKWDSDGSANGLFGITRGVAFDSSGNIYVSASRIHKFEPAGTFLAQWGAYPVLFYPYGIAVDKSDNVYVAVQGYHRIDKFTSSGTLVSRWGSQGTGDGQFNDPYGIAVDSSGSVYVTDYSNNRVQKFASDGVFLAKWGQSGKGSGQFDSPHGIAVDPSGFVYVVDKSNSRVQIFTSSGGYVSKIGGISGPGNGQLTMPRGVAVDGSGNVFVADAWNHRIQKFKPRTATLLPSLSRQVSGPSTAEEIKN